MKRLLNRILDRRKILDTNIILRYLLNDDASLSDKARQIISTENCIAYLEVISEVVFVLQSPRCYGIPRCDIAEQLRLLSDEILIDKWDVLDCALNAYVEKPKLDFVDCLLYGYSQNGYSVETFDKRLSRKLPN
ncbi:MAG: type II toxin-antitoxin system VapC family toxin [Lachnospiraceae bacterium]|nr:type II toxin-antitoxin system VapC family toxin [Lachnospiraceae bacterium]